MKRLIGSVQLTQPAEEKVMPALLWVAFWSSLMATAACLGEMSRAASVDKHDGADAPDAENTVPKMDSAFAGHAIAGMVAAVLTVLVGPAKPAVCR